MTTLLDSPAPSVVEALRGERRRRPLADRASSSGLRAQLEDGIFEVTAGHRPAAPIVIRTSSLRVAPLTTDLASSSLGRLRGVLLIELLRLASVGFQVESPFDDALDAWRCQSSSGAVADGLERLNRDEVARLATDVEAHWTTLRRALGTVPGPWLPRSALRVSQHLGGGDVVLADTVDLMLGSTNTDVASVTLLDVTTSPLGDGAERALRFHALVQTLRTGVVPLRSSAFSSATGELWVRDVDRELLQRGVRDVLEALGRLWRNP